MSTASLPGYAELAEELRALETGLEPAELHGSLCGWLAGGGPHDRAGWFAAVMADPLLSAPEADGLLDQRWPISHASPGANWRTTSRKPTRKRWAKSPSSSASR